MEFLLSLAFCFALAAVLFHLFTLPIKIGKKKALSPSEMRPIRILNWCALLAGITWFIALYLAITAKSRPLHRR